MSTNKTNKSKSNNDYWELRRIEDNSANYETVKTNTTPNWTDKSKVNNDYWELRGIEDNSVISAKEYYENGLDKMSYDEYGNRPSKQDFIRAIEDFTKAIEINPSYWEAFFRRGMAKANINDNKGAIEDFTIIITYNSDKQSIRQATGWIRTLKKR